MKRGYYYEKAYFMLIIIALVCTAGASYAYEFHFGPAGLTIQIKHMKVIRFLQPEGKVISSTWKVILSTHGQLELIRVF